MPRTGSSIGSAGRGRGKPPKLRPPRSLFPPFPLSPALPSSPTDPRPTPAPPWLPPPPPPPAPVLATRSRQLDLPPAAGVVRGWTIPMGWNPLAGLGASIERLVGVLGDAGNAKVILFTLVIGALIATVEAGGGVRGFVDWI